MGLSEQREKEMHATIRMSRVATYVKGSELILKHWIWKLLKDKTEHFGPLLRVFSSNPCTTSSCGTSSWTHIFTLYPLAGANLTHKLLASGLEKCLTFKDDSSAAFTEYICCQRICLSVRQHASHVHHVTKAMLSRSKKYNKWDSSTIAVSTLLPVL